MKRCHKCGAPWMSEKKQPAVKEYCENCTAYLHCCKNCRFHAPSRHNQCQIGTTEWVGDREGANFCDEFEFADADTQGKDTAKSAKAKDALDSLFGGEEQAKPKLDDFKKLFGE